MKIVVVVAKCEWTFNTLWEPKTINRCHSWSLVYPVSIIFQSKCVLTKDVNDNTMSNNFMIVDDVGG